MSDMLTLETAIIEIRLLVFRIELQFRRKRQLVRAMRGAGCEGSR